MGRLWRPFSNKDAEAKLRLCRIERCDPGEGIRSQWSLLLLTTSALEEVKPEQPTEPNR